MADRPSAQERAERLFQFRPVGAGDGTTSVYRVPSVNEVAAAITDAEDAARREAIEECAKAIEETATYACQEDAEVMCGDAAMLRALATSAQD